MKEKITSRNGVSSNFLIANLFGTGNSAVINVQIGPTAVAKNVIDMGFEQAYITSLSNIFVPFSTGSDIAPTMSDEDKDDFNKKREERVDFAEPDGKDFAVYPNHLMYYSQRTIDYGVVPTIGDKPITSFDLSINNYPEDDEKRSVAFKLPCFFAGWGFDTAGRPVPSVYDVQKKMESEELEELEESEEEEDKLEIERRKNTFDSGYNLSPENWPAGPLDVRWDRGRKVWAAAPVEVQGYLVTEMPAPTGRLTKSKYTSGEMIIYGGEGDAWKPLEPMQKVWVINRSVGLTSQSGTYIIARLMGNNEFRPIWTDCATDPSGAMNHPKETEEEEED